MFCCNPLCVSLLMLRPALAFLYPTSPIADTVYDAGEAASVEWIDDGKTPYLQDMTITRIDLYRDDDAFIATLATDVDPSRKFQTVTIPSDVVEDTKYILHFLCGGRQDLDVRGVIYTAYFKIRALQFAINETSDSSSLPVDILGDVATSALNNSNPTNLYQPLFTVVLPNTTYVSTLLPTTKIFASSTQSVSPQGGSTPSGARGEIDWSCRLGFIFWPAILGFSMAL